MKKSLLILAGALAAAVPAMAVAPTVIDNLSVANVSPNGNWVVFQSPSFDLVIYDMANDTFYSCQAAEAGDDEYGVGEYGVNTGNIASNTGIVLGSCPEYNDVPSYWKGAKWYALPLPEDCPMGIGAANGVTPDGSAICGYIPGAKFSAEEDNIMCLPAVWNLNASSEYEFTALPYPEKDFSGRTPQYVLPQVISADGKTIAGQVMDYTGSFPQPIIYTKGADGEWSYKMLMADVFNNPDLVWPTDPGEGPTYPSAEAFLSPEGAEAYAAAEADYYAYTANEPTVYMYMTEDELDAYQQAVAEFDWESGMDYPQVEDFMTEEEKEAYQDALTEYYDNMPEYPSAFDYMTPEEQAAYNAAMEAYDAANEAWWAAYSEFTEKFDENTANFPTFVMNNSCLSGNAKYYATTNSEATFFNPVGASYPYLFNLETGEITIVDVPGTLNVTQVNDNGAMLAVEGINSMMQVRNAYISPIDGEPFMPISTYMQTRNASTYDWMKQNMRHDYEEYTYDPETYEDVIISHTNAWITGLPFADANFSTFYTWNANIWDFDDPAYYYSYIIPVGDPAGINAAVADKNLSVKGAKGGIIAVAGQAAKVEVFDVNGRLVFSADAPAATIATGLQQGIYVIKATAADGSAVIAKAAM